LLGIGREGRSSQPRSFTSMCSGMPGMAESSATILSF
jgi:hypothetical protein